MYPGIFTRITGLLGDELVYQESGPNGPQAWVVQQVGSLQGRAEAIATKESRGADMSCLGCKLCVSLSEKSQGVITMEVLKTYVHAVRRAVYWSIE